MPLNLNFVNYKKLLICSSVTAVVGIFGFEVIQIRRSIASLVQPNVLDLEKRGPEYIYIKYHIYRETLNKMKQKEQEKSKIINVMLHPIGKWWKAMEHSIAWRLLEISQKGDQVERNKAVRQLVVVDNLKDWDFQHLAQLCDARTAVSLARSDCDVRWFLKPKMHKVLKNSKSLIIEIRQLFEDMRPNKCIDYFINKTFGSHEIKEPEIDDLFVSHGTALPTQEADLLRQCVSEFLHLSSNQKYAKEIVEKAGLVILMEIYKIFANDIEVKEQLSQIISNLSLCYENINHFFVTGWIRILAEWRKENELKISVNASKALSNLDRDDPNNFIYHQKIYPLYPRFRTKRTPSADVVFIHGLLGSVFVTWRQKDRVEPPIYSNGNITKEKSKLKNIEESRIKKFEKIKGMSDVNTKVMIKNISYEHESNNNKNNKISDFCKEIIESLDSEGELPSEWEIVFPDCPLKSTATTEGPYSTSGSKWTNENETNEYSNCWPKDWLPYDLPNIRVIGCNYESNLSHWSAAIGCSCDKIGGKLHTRGREFLEYLAQSKVGQNRPVIFVGHSMGGLIAKTIIVQSLESDDENIRAIGENTKAVLFLGTPHRGSSVAKLKQHTQIILSPTIEVVEMTENAKHLLILHEKFLSYVKDKIDIVSFIEGLPTVISAPFKFKIVTESSAKIDTGDTYILNEDHLGISKPVFRQSFLYQRILQTIKKAIHLD